MGEREMRIPLLVLVRVGKTIPIVILIFVTGRGRKNTYFAGGVKCLATIPQRPHTGRLCGRKDEGILPAFAPREVCER